MQRSDTPQEIACQQVLVDESAVFSAQWMVISGRYGAIVTPRFLLDSYLKYLRRATFSLVRPHLSTEGVEFRLLSTAISILGFAPPESTGDGHSLTLAIRGGLLVQPEACRRGKLSFLAQPEGESLRVVLSLSDYCPLLLGGLHPSRLRRWLYRLTQAFIHKKVTVSFLSRVYRDVAGEGACVKVVRVRPVSGEEI